MFGQENVRPTPLIPGTLLGQHYRIQALVRMSETRLFYLADDQRDDVSHRHCWSCGSDENTKADTHCARCGKALPSRTRFLICSRWNRPLFDSFTRFYERRITHPAMLRTEDMFFHEGNLYTVYRYRNEALLLDEGSPYGRDHLLHLAQRFTGLLAYLQQQGVTLAGMQRPNFLLRPQEDLYFFDPDIEEVQDQPLPDYKTSTALRSLAQTLQEFVAVNMDEVASFFSQVVDGGSSSPMDLGREVEQLWDRVEERPPPAWLSALTDVGRVRTLNEDNWGWCSLSEDTHLYIVADGMGGHDCGEVASALAVETMRTSARRRLHEDGVSGEEDLATLLEGAFQDANNTIKEMAEASNNDMGTTLVAAVVRNEIAFVANVGDSRGYLMRGDTLHRVTQDHSLVARMVEHARLTEEQARVHPHSNILLRTVGTERDVEIDIFRLELQPGDRLLLCSDGLWGEMPHEQMQDIIVRSTEPRACARELMRAAHRGGGKDNLTIVMVGVSDE